MTNTEKRWAEWDSAPEGPESPGARCPPTCWHRATCPTLSGSAGTDGSIPFLPRDLGGEDRRRELQVRTSPHPAGQLPRHSTRKSRVGPHRRPPKLPLGSSFAPTTKAWPAALQHPLPQGEKGEENLNNLEGNPSLKGTHCGGGGLRGKQRGLSSPPSPAAPHLQALRKLAT